MAEKRRVETVGERVVCALRASHNPLRDKYSWTISGVRSGPSQNGLREDSG